MKQNGFRLKALVGAMLSTSLLLGANSAFAERATFSAPGAFNSASDIAVSSGSDAVGDTLLFPYYTNENGNSTLLHIVNTSARDTVIAKIRLRDFATSADGIDFTVILSPEDVFSGTINKLASGANVFKRSGDDNTCTSPLATNSEYTDPLEFSSDTDHTGHIEVITLATFNEDDYATNGVTTTAGVNVLQEIAENALHSKDAAHEPPGCSLIDKYFNSQKDSKGRFIGLLQDALDDVEIRSHLFGQFAVLNIGTGVEAGGRPTTIANAYRAVDANNDGDYDDAGDKALHSPCYLGSGNVATDGNSIICGQFPIHYSYPHLAHVAGVDVTGTMDATKVASNVANFNYFQDTIRANSMANEWSVKNSNGVLSEMIFTFPTKYVFNDAKEMKVVGTINDQDMISEEVFTGFNTITVDNLFWDDVDNALNATSSTSAAVGYFDDATGCVAKSNDVLNREEGRNITISNTSVSGAANPETIEEGLCNEVTAITHITEDRQEGNGVTQKALDANGNPNPVIRNADSTGVFQEFGWMKVMIANEKGQMGAGLPMIGYSMWQRTFNNDASASYGHLMDNVKFK